MSEYLKLFIIAMAALAILVLPSSASDGWGCSRPDGGNLTSPGEIQTWYEYNYPSGNDDVSDPGGCETDEVVWDVPSGQYSFPPIAYESNVTILENTPVEIALHAMDPDGDPVTYAIVLPPSHGILEEIIAHTVIYTPDADFTGFDEFTFRAHDGVWDSNSASVTITVEPNGSRPLSHAFHGRVILDGEPAPEYTLVSAEGPGVRSNCTGNPVTTQADGSYGSPNGTIQNLLVQGRIKDGAPLTFSIDGIRAEVSDADTSGPWRSSYPFRAGGVTNLTIRTPPPVPHQDTVYINAIGVTISNSSYGYSQTIKLEKKPWVELKVTPGMFDIQITVTGYHDFRDRPLFGRDAILGIYESGNLLSPKVSIPFGSKIVRYDYRATETKTFDILIYVNESPEVYDLKQMTIYVTE